jgi:hypothetical protein
MYTF